MIWLATGAQSLPADLCLTAARQAAAQSGVPASVMIAITQAETGRGRGGRLEPWPWTINLEGAGHWFETRQEAMEFAQTSLNANAVSFDVGCFQINYRWHSDQFASLDQMFDPLANALYAARFLNELYSEKGDWTLAAGAYHSRTEEFASRYRDRFDTLRTAAVNAGADEGVIVAAADREPATARTPRVNSFPLLQQSSGGRQLGSLVPLGGS